MATQSARQNATNSELDAKKIVTHSGLTSTPVSYTHLRAHET